MIREMCSEDILNVQQIEEQCFPHPWTFKQLCDELKKPMSTALVFEENSRILGYIIVWNIADELEIGRIATHTDMRQKGIAKKLLYFTFNLLSPDVCFLEVSHKNKSAIQFYKHLSFQEVSVRKQYYQDNSDAIIMKLTF